MRLTELFEKDACIDVRAFDHLPIEAGAFHLVDRGNTISNVSSTFAKQAHSLSRA